MERYTNPPDQERHPVEAGPTCGEHCPSQGSLLLTVAEVAERLRVSPSAVYALCAEGRLAHHRVGVGRGTIRVSEEQLKQYLEENTCGKKEEATPKAAPVKLRHLNV